MKYAKRSDRKRKCYCCGEKFYTRKRWPYRFTFTLPLRVLYCAKCRKPLVEGQKVIGLEGKYHIMPNNGGN